MFLFYRFMSSILLMLSVSVLIFIVSLIRNAIKLSFIRKIIYSSIRSEMRNFISISFRATSFIITQTSANKMLNKT